MSNYLGISIEIGGTLPASLLQNFISTIHEDLNDITGHSSEQELLATSKLNKTLSYYATAKYGECPHLKTFCRNYGLSYVHLCEGSDESDASSSYWKPGMKSEKCYLTNTNGDSTVRVETIRPLVLLLLEYAKKGPDALPLFISDKNEDVLEIIEKSLKDIRKFFPLLRKKFDNLLPEDPTLPPFLINDYTINPKFLKE
jgi:hypothetical protein